MVEENREGLINRGIYKHYKGGHYIILGFGIHEKSLKTCVIYSSIENPTQVWIRTVNDWMTEATVVGQSVKRFELINKI
jgi:hypothetical protein